MINMAYCRCQNTLEAPREVYQGVDDIDDLSPEEQAAFKRIVNLCRKIVDYYEEMI